MSTEALDRLWEAHFIRDIGLPSIGSLDPIGWFVLFTLPMLPLGYFGAGFLMKRFEHADAPRLVRVLIVLVTVMMVGADRLRAGGRDCRRVRARSSCTASRER